MIERPASVQSFSEMERGYRLQQIFLPHAALQRDSFYGRQPGQAFSLEGMPARFAHYTTADAALSIIQNKRMWMRNATAMSDYREVHHGFEIINRFFSDEPKIKAFEAAINSCAPGAMSAAVTQFNAWWQSIQTDTYVMSISQHKASEDLRGRLSMWRAFGSNSSAKVALVVNIPWFSGASQVLNLLFSPVTYLPEPEVHAAFQRVIANVRTEKEFLSQVPRDVVQQAIFSMLVMSVTCMKHEGFQEELEWRAIYLPKMWPSPLMEASTVSIGGVPQIVYEIPLDKYVSESIAGLDLAAIFDRLIIGPSPYPRVMYQAFVDALTTAGVQGAEKLVFVSDIPIRS